MWRYFTLRHLLLICTDRKGDRAIMYFFNWIIGSRNVRFDVLPGSLFTCVGSITTHPVLYLYLYVNVKLIAFALEISTKNQKN